MLPYSCFFLELRNVERIIKTLATISKIPVEIEIIAVRYEIESLTAWGLAGVWKKQGYYLYIQYMTVYV